MKSCKVIFVNQKSEISNVMRVLEKRGAKCYRTRMNCNCAYPFNFRHGALVVEKHKETLLVTHKIIRCKACAKGGRQ